MLTRESLSSGEYLASFDAMPQEIRWTRNRIEHSLAETLRVRPRPDEVWIFGYGSLIWNPLLDFDKRQWATLHGWHRSFCVSVIAGRGNAQAPGRMLALEPGGITQGVAFRLSALTAARELSMVWTREMLFGTYRPTWSVITLADGTQAMALVFVADPSYPLYEQDSTVSTVAPLMAAASGPHGSNAEYVLRLERALADGGVTDEYVEAIAAALKRLSAQG